MKGCGKHRQAGTEGMKSPSNNRERRNCADIQSSNAEKWSKKTKIKRMGNSLHCTIIILLHTAITVVKLSNPDRFERIYQ